MRNEGAKVFGRLPVRVLLRGDPDGWHYVVVDKEGGEERTDLGGPGSTWHKGDPEPAWWGRRLTETAEDMRDRLGRLLTDRTFDELGLEADISWFAIEEPLEWEGLVTLRDADPARFPGEVAPYVVALEPGRGAILPEAHLLFSTLASDAWSTLRAVADECGTAAPRASFLCGWADHRSVRVGRGLLAVSTSRRADGSERLAEIYGERSPGWGGNPELRFRLDGIDLLDEPAADVVALFRDLGHAPVHRGRTWHLSTIGLTLYEPENPYGSFTGVALRPTA